jgi:hypothetical protein
MVDTCTRDTLEEAREAEFVRQYLGACVRNQDNDKEPQ